VTGADYLEPLIALLVVCLLGVLGRWVFAPNYRKHRKDYGLLVPVATITARAEAERVRDRLRAAGLRATLGDSNAITRVTHDGFAIPQPPGHHVLVFPQDYERAKNVLS
jgi:hypothetical protein